MGPNGNDRATARGERHPHHHGHDHGGVPAGQRAPAKLAIVLALTLGFTLVAIVGGLISNSLTLLAEAGHMSTDVAALVLAWFGARMAQRREGSPRHFGNLRWEVLAAMMNGLLLFFVGAWITIQAIDRFGHPRVIDASLFGGIAALGLLVNLASLRVLHGHHEHDLNARGAYLHILGDVLGSIGAIVGAVIIHYTAWSWVDPAVSILVSVIILRSAGRLVRTSAFILLDKVPDQVQTGELERRLLATPGVNRVHDLHVWTVASGLIAMSAHAVVPELERHPAVLRDLEHQMSDLGIRHITIQLETGGECEGELCGDEEGFPATTAVSGHSHTHH